MGKEGREVTSETLRHLLGGSRITGLRSSPASNPASPCQPRCLLPPPTRATRPSQPLRPQAVLLAISPKARCHPVSLSSFPAHSTALCQSRPRPVLWANATPSALSASSESLLSQDKALSRTHSCMLPRAPAPAQGKPSSRSVAALYAGVEPAPYQSGSSRAQLPTAPATREHPSDAAAVGPARPASERSRVPA